ncbi:type VI secretion system Vgr family protein [compost metagenome]
MRFVHGTVSAFVQGNTGFRRTRYRATMEPRLARLQLASDWRIFQTLSVPDIAQAVLKKHSITLDYEQKATKTPIRDGDVAACGARLIASRHGVSWEG